MSLASRPPERPRGSTLEASIDKSLRKMSGNSGKITKAKWTSKWTRGQFGPKSYPANSIRIRHDETHPAPSLAPVDELAVTIGELMKDTLPQTGPSKQSTKTTGNVLGRLSSEPKGLPVEAQPRLQASSAFSASPNSGSVSPPHDDFMADETAYATSRINTVVSENVSADSVPRSFERTVLASAPEPDGSGKDLRTQAPAFRAAMAGMHEDTIDLTQDSPPTSNYAYEETTTERKPDIPSTPVRSNATTFTTPINAEKEVIYIESSDESDVSDETGEVSPLPSSNTGLEASSRSPDRRIPISSVEDVWTHRLSESAEVERLSATGQEIQSIEDKQPEGLASGREAQHNPRESSEDDVPLSVLRRKRDAAKRRSINKRHELHLVNRPAAMRKQSVAAPKKKPFDSHAFDVMIYSQSQQTPPRGVVLPRQARLRNITPRITPLDDMIYVAANPAIHKPVQRSEKWQREKTREIRARPNRKRWFGKLAERTRWLRDKRVEDETKRRPQTRGSVGRTLRRDPEPASYNRVMDYGDVPEHQLPRDVQQHSSWLKACEWFRANREEDRIAYAEHMAARVQEEATSREEEEQAYRDKEEQEMQATIQRAVEHSTQLTWRHYQNILNEEDDYLS